MKLQYYPKVVIIILNWNGKSDTTECIESLYRIDYSRYEIIIVDNKSTDGSIAHFENQYPEIEIIKNRKNLGFAGGNNIGIYRAIEKGAEYILLLNNDTIVDNKFLEELIITSQKDKDIGIVGPKIYCYNDPIKICTYPKSHNLYTGNFTLARNMVNDNNFAENKEVDYINGCCMLVNSKIIKNIGCFDTDYFLYWEETDWCYRIKSAGFKLIYAPKAKIWHKIGSSKNVKSFYYFSRNLFLFEQKNASSTQLIVFLIFFFTFRFFIQSAILILFHRDTQVFISFIKGTKDGIFSLFNRKI